MVPVSSMSDYDNCTQDYVACQTVKILPMVQLMEHNPTTIKRFGLRKFCSAAFYLMVKLVPGYVWMWCKNYSKTVPDDTSFNKAVTLQIDYSRK
ncbi:hypothetical protein DPMN_073091 [Dreissena polymorpha]|uniref:Uncharacterized protein n=1 Tax=Dreissena polymorpha TaxID=45954 RepID=A0A9D4BYJ5_DREPO|nr:hypothetical protein DPMN_073091 [Dreissena polymorpha]